MGSLHEVYTEDCEVDYQECFHDPKTLHTELPTNPNKPHSLISTFPRDERFMFMYYSFNNKPVLNRLNVEFRQSCLWLLNHSKQEKGNNYWAVEGQSTSTRTVIVAFTWCVMS
mgnify:CR=1 FL=1